MPIGVRLLVQWAVHLHESVLKTAIVLMANAIDVIGVVIYWSVRIMFEMVIKPRFRQISGGGTS
jgi:hypothetical protein